MNKQETYQKITKEQIIEIIRNNTEPYGRVNENEIAEDVLKLFSEVLLPSEQREPETKFDFVIENLDKLDNLLCNEDFSADEAREIIYNLKQKFAFEIIMPCVFSPTVEQPKDMDAYNAVMALREELKKAGKDENEISINSWLMGVNWCKDFNSKPVEQISELTEEKIKEVFSKFSDEYYDFAGDHKTAISLDGFTKAIIALSLSSPSKSELTEEEIKDWLRLRNYFSERDQTQFQHWAYSFLSKHILSLTSPSKEVTDEQIYEASVKDNPQSKSYSTEERLIFQRGAKWMRKQISTPKEEKQLSEITDEHLVALVKIEGLSNVSIRRQGAIIFMVDDSYEIIFDTINYHIVLLKDGKKIPLESEHQMWQYLQSKNYQLPKYY